MDRIATPLTPSLESEPAGASPGSGRTLLRRITRQASLLVPALSLLALSGCADSGYDPRTGVYHPTGYSPSNPPRAYYHDYSDAPPPGYHGEQPPPEQDGSGYYEQGYGPNDGPPPPPDSDPGYAYVEDGPPPDFDPYYTFGGVSFFFVDGRYFYYRNHHRYYVNRLPRGGSYYRGHGGYSHSDYRYSGGYRDDHRHDYHGDHHDYHQPSNAPYQRRYPQQGQNNSQNGKNNSQNKKKDHQQN